MICMKCFQEQGHPDEMFYPAELQDNGLYWMKCRNGHETVTCLQEQKFELLFDLAANAIVDGYYREAVLSFTSALECFCQFYIQVMSVRFNIGEETFTEAWKRVAAQSERQLGAYTFLYLIDNGQPAPALSGGLIKFRNDVIHKGKIPTKDEAIGYGQAVLDIVAPALAALKAKYPDHLDTIVTRHIKKTQKQIEGVPHTSFLSISTTISITRVASERQPTLSDTLAELTRKRGRSRR